ERPVVTRDRLRQLPHSMTGSSQIVVGLGRGVVPGRGRQVVLLDDPDSLSENGATPCKNPTRLQLYRLAYGRSAARYAALPLPLQGRTGTRRSPARPLFVLCVWPKAGRQ